MDEIGEFSFFSDETEIVGEGLPPPSPPLTPSKHNTRGSASPRKVPRVTDGKRGSSEEAASFTIPACLAKRSLFPCCTAIHMQWVGHIPARTVLSELTSPSGKEKKKTDSHALHGVVTSRTMRSGCCYNPPATNCNQTLYTDLRANCLWLCMHETDVT